MAVIVEHLQKIKIGLHQILEQYFKRWKSWNSRFSSHNFNQLGIIKIDKKEISDEYIFELALEAGADECKTNDDFHEIQCHVSEIYNVKKELEKSN